MTTALDIVLPTLHPDQVKAYQYAARFKAIRCGRRWGKTEFAKTIACSAAIAGQPIGWFAPDYKILSEAFSEIAEALQPCKRSSSRTQGVIRTITGGRIDFWSLENERAGRSRKYRGVIIDEAGFAKANMLKIWQQAIMPTLLDLKGWALALSNTNGVDPDNFLWQICNEPQHGFVEYHAPSHGNPFLPVEELERLQRDTPPLVYQQEYLAEFVDWSGVQFFELAKMLDENGEPVAFPTYLDAVFATIDTAVKTGKDNDATGVIYWGISKTIGAPLVLLDWDIAQIEGSLLETWLPTVFQNLEAICKRTRVRLGSIGAHIEDKVSGTILIQQAQRRDLDAHAIDSKLTSVGKDERALSVSGYVYRGEVKICREAYEKVGTYKGATRNHLLTQVLGFRMGDKTTNRADDLLDCFTYGIAIALGDNQGY